MVLIKDGPHDVRGPRKTIKPVQAGVKGSLSNLESGHVAPFPPQDFCSPCVCVFEY